MTTQNIFNTVMPDLHERKQQMQSIIAKHSNPEFAEKVCAGLSPLFYFCTQKSWEILDDPYLEDKVEMWIRKAGKGIDKSLVFVGTWLLILLEYKKDYVKFQLVSNMLVKYMLENTNLRVSSRRFVTLVDNPGKDFKSTELTCDIDFAKFMRTWRHANKTYPEEVHDDLKTYFHEEIGDPRVCEYERKKGATSVIDELAKELISLKKKINAGKATAEERVNYNLFCGLITYNPAKRKYVTRYEMKETDDASSVLRSNAKYLYETLDKSIDQALGSGYIKSGIKTGRIYSWKGVGMQIRQAMALDTCKKIIEALKTSDIYLGCKRLYTLLNKLQSDDLSLINSFYFTGKELNFQRGTIDPIDDIFDMVKTANVEMNSEYLSGRNNLLQCMESGLEYYGII